MTDQGKGGQLLGYTSLYGSIPGGKPSTCGFHRPTSDRQGPADTPRRALSLLSDVLPTAWQGVAYADVTEGGTCTVIGLGPVGQMAARIANTSAPAWSSASTGSPSASRWRVETGS